MNEQHLPYVAASYALFAAALLWDWVLPRLRERRALKAVLRRRQREAARRAA